MKQDNYIHWPVFHLETLVIYLTVMGGLWEVVCALVYSGLHAGLGP